MTPCRSFAIATVLVGAISVLGTAQDASSHRDGQGTVKMIVSLTDAEGKIRGSFQALPSPPREPLNAAPSIMIVASSHNIRSSDNEVISALGFIGWIDEDKVHVSVRMFVPKPGAPNEFAPRPARADLAQKALAEIVLSIGESKDIAPYTKIGGEPLTLTAQKSS